MAVKIRLTRMGRKKRPFYRIVVTDSRSPRDGRYIECLGTYNPVVNPPEVNVAEDRTCYWLDQGAIPTDTVRSLLRRKGMIYKRYLMKKGLDEAGVAEEMKKWEVLQIERHRREEAKIEDKRKKMTEKPEVKTEDEKKEIKEDKTVDQPESVSGVKKETAPGKETADKSEDSEVNTEVNTKDKAEAKKEESKEDSETKEERTELQTDA